MRVSYMRVGGVLFYASARVKERSDRIDKGHKKGPKPSTIKDCHLKLCPRQFAKRRRKELSSEIEANGTASIVTEAELSVKDSTPETDPTWDPKMTALQNALAVKRAKKLMDDIHAGVPVETRLLNGMSREEITRIFQLNLDRLAKSRAADARKRRNVFLPMEVPDLKHIGLASQNFVPPKRPRALGVLSRREVGISNPAPWVPPTSPKKDPPAR